MRRVPLPGKALLVVAVAAVAVVGAVTWTIHSRSVTGLTVDPTTDHRSPEQAQAQAQAASPAPGTSTSAPDAPAPPASVPPPATSSTVAPAAPTTKVLFQDDFNGPAGSLPDHDKWVDFIGGFGSIREGDDETLDGAGRLVLPATPQYGTSIRTWGKFDFVYGTASAWMKLPKEAGYWPAFWMINNPDGGPRYAGEIDVLEAYTTWPDKTHSIIHAWNPKEAVWAKEFGYCVDGVDTSAAFHKYSVRIEPHKISFFFDDKPCAGVMTPDTAGKPWVWGPDVMTGNWLILDLAVGGADGAQTPATRPAKLLVDRVEVRSL